MKKEMNSRESNREIERCAGSNPENSFFYFFERRTYMFFRKPTKHSLISKYYRLADKYLSKSNRSKNNLQRTHYYQKYCHYLSKATQLDREEPT